jgi:hypothetical protein
VIETLVAALLASIVLAAALSLLRVHGVVARRFQSELAARSIADWAIGVTRRDIAFAGADPARLGFAALRSASGEHVELESDLDGDGAIDGSSAERILLARAGPGDGRFLRWVGRQPMSLAAPVPTAGVRLRYFDAAGVEIGAGGGALADAERARVCRVTFELAVREVPDRPTGEVRLRSAAALRSCFRRS